jgi:hypothetical protein
VLTLIFVVVAGGSLAAGWLLGLTILVYLALGVSALGLALVVADWWRRRRRVRAVAAEMDAEVDAAADADDPADEATVDVSADEAIADGAADDSADDPADDPELEPALAPDSVVYVVTGRRRFHVPGCSSLDGSDPEELTLFEAREESFTPCTLCVDKASRSQLVRQP